MTLRPFLPPPYLSKTFPSVSPRPSPFRKIHRHCRSRFRVSTFSRPVQVPIRSRDSGGEQGCQVHLRRLPGPVRLRRYQPGLPPTRGSGTLYVGPPRGLSPFLLHRLTPPSVPEVDGPPARPPRSTPVLTVARGQEHVAQVAPDAGVVAGGGNGRTTAVLAGARAGGLGAERWVVAEGTVMRGPSSWDPPYPITPLPTHPLSDLRFDDIEPGITVPG